MPAYRDKQGRWRFRKWVKLPNGERTRISGTPTRNTKQAAEAEERCAIDRAIQHCLNPPAAKRMEAPTLQDFMPEFIRNYAQTNNKPSTVYSKQNVFQNHLLPAFGKVRLDQIDQRSIEKFKADKLQTLDPYTVNNHLRLLRTVLTVACEWRLIEKAPQVKRVREQEKSVRFLLWEETVQLLAAADGQWRLMILTGLRTGLRISELVALTFDDIDFERRVLTVRRRAWNRQLDTPKNNRTRVIPLSDELWNALWQHRHNQSAFVFCSPKGTMLHNSSCKRPLARISERAGLGPRMGWHVLRHTFASHLVMQGVPLKVVQELLGHADIEMTMRYAHLSPCALKDAVKVFDRLSGAHGGPIEPGVLAASVGDVSASAGQVTANGQTEANSPAPQ